MKPDDARATTLSNPTHGSLLPLRPGPGYAVLYADPPWCYRNRRTGGSLRSGAASQYPTLTLDELAALPVAAVAAPAAVCYLWATVPLLPDALTVLAGWGFPYRTMLTWHKTGRLGMGFWVRGQTEHLLLGVRGAVRPPRLAERNVIACAPERHSAKPAAFRTLIERMQAASQLEGPRVELFARTATPGWTCVGRELGTDVRAWLGARNYYPTGSNRPTVAFPV